LAAITATTDARAPSSVENTIPQKNSGDVRSSARGEHLFAGIDLPALGYACTEHVATPAATHIVLTNTAP